MTQQHAALTTRHVTDWDHEETNADNADRSVCVCVHSVTHYTSVPSTHHFQHPSPTHSFTRRLKLSFSANPSRRSLPFLLPDRLHGFPELLTDTSEHISVLSF